MHIQYCRMHTDGQSYLPSVSCIYAFRDFPSIMCSDVNNYIMLRILRLPHERPIQNREFTIRLSEHNTVSRFEPYTVSCCFVLTKRRNISI
jgi:hypothetical protein